MSGAEIQVLGPTRRLPWQAQPWTECEERGAWWNQRPQPLIQGRGWGEKGRKNKEAGPRGFENQASGGKNGVVWPQGTSETMVDAGTELRLGTLKTGP